MENQLTYMFKNAIVISLITFFVTHQLPALAQVKFEWNGSSKLNFKKKEKKEPEKVEAKSNGNSNGTASINEGEKSHAKAVKVYTPEEKAKILDKANYPNYAEDKVKIDEIYKLYNVSNVYYYFTVKMVEGMSNSSTSLEKYNQLYGEYWKVYKEEIGKTEEVSEKHMIASSKINELKEGLDYKYTGDLVADFKKKINKVVIIAEEKSTILDTEAGKQTTEDSREKDSKYNWREVQTILDDVYIEALILKSKGEKEEVIKELMKKREETIAKIEPFKKQYTDKVTKLLQAEYDAAYIPKEAYMKPDKEVLRKKVMTLNNSCKETKLVKVIFIDKEWERQKGSDYSASSKSFSDYDYSYLNLALVYNNPSKNPEIGYLVDRIRLVKNNLTNSLNDPEFTCPEESVETGYYVKFLMKNISK